MLFKRTQEKSAHAPLSIAPVHGAIASLPMQVFNCPLKFIAFPFVSFDGLWK
jgi:hypothetical protein